MEGWILYSLVLLSLVTNATLATQNEGKTPFIAATYNLRARKHLEGGVFDKAAEEFSIAISLGWNTPAVFANRGAAYWALGKYDKSIKDFNEAIKRGVTDRVYSYRGRAHVGKGEFRLAIDDLTKGIEVGDGAESMYERGYAYWKVNDLRSALNDIDAAIKLKPNSADFYYGRGVVYMDSLKDFQKAIADFDSSIKLNQKNVRPHIGKADV